MAVATYRAFILDEAGNVVSLGACFECSDDDEAMERVRSDLEGYAVEVWVDDRCIGMAVPDRGASSSAPVDLQIPNQQ